MWLVVGKKGRKDVVGSKRDAKASITLCFNKINRKQTHNDQMTTNQWIEMVDGSEKYKYPLLY